MCPQRRRLDDGRLVHICVCTYICRCVRVALRDNWQFPFEKCQALTALFVQHAIFNHFSIIYLTPTIYFTEWINAIKSREWNIIIMECELLKQKHQRLTVNLFHSKWRILQYFSHFTKENKLKFWALPRVTLEYFFI